MVLNIVWALVAAPGSFWDMLHLMWRLLWRSALYVPSLVSQNWLAVITLTVLAPIIRWIIKTWRLRRLAAINWADFWDTVVSGIIVSVGLFAWSVVKTVYSDHIKYATENQQLRAENRTLKDSAGPKITGTFDVFIGPAKNASDSYVIVSGVITNQGAPSIITRW